MGEEFEEAYRLVEANLDGEILLYKKINARDLFKSIMRSQVETGMPYIAFKDTIKSRQS
jgi:ribonucleoside-diphosphate reductase alpha chain